MLYKLRSWESSVKQINRQHSNGTISWFSYKHNHSVICICVHTNSFETSCLWAILSLVFICEFSVIVDICDYATMQFVNQILFVCRDLMKHTTFFTLSFKDNATERDYNLHKESFSSVSVMGCPLVLLITSTAQFVVLPRLVSLSRRDMDPEHSPGIT
jgi:hypothetical protein